MSHRRFLLAWRAAAVAATVLLTGCFDAPELKTARVMDNFKNLPQQQERIVAERNYIVGQRYRIEPGQVMLRSKLYTVIAGTAVSYRADTPLAATGDGVRIEIPQGARLRIADRILVNGKLANVVPLTPPPANAPDVSAIFVNDEGLLFPGVLRGGQIVTFATYLVEPKKAQLTPEFQESVKTSAGYINYEVLYHGYATRKLADCTAARDPGSKQDEKDKKLVADCGSTVHLELSIVQYDRLQLERASVVNRTWYPVRSNALNLSGLNINVHEVAPEYMVFEVARGDYAFRKLGF